MEAREREANVAAFAVVDMEVGAVEIEERAEMEGVDARRGWGGGVTRKACWPGA